MSKQGQLHIKLILILKVCPEIQAIAIFMCFNVVDNVITEVPGLLYYENFNAIYFFLSEM